MLMFDTLSRRFLSTYGNSWVKTPNFERLQKCSVQFNNFFCGSLPCMPARRELHTGRYNFLHRSWGPLEPFDVSVIELLKKQGVYTHIVTDHSHYWEDGGSTYLPRYNSWEGFRGQEGDRWVGVVNPKSIHIPKQLSTAKQGVSLFHNWANREKMISEDDYSSAKTVAAGINFIRRNHKEHNWFLQIECFDPHEPFIVPERFLALYNDTYIGDTFDWPAYTTVSESEQEKKHLIKEYAALISMCDEYLGKILDVMDEFELWKDTMLIVNTDHGFLMGEHEWWGKNVQPCYNEIAHLPFYMYNPKMKQQGITKHELCQTIDIAPTLLEFFNIDAPNSMLGKSIIPLIQEGKEIHDAILFGSFGQHVNVCDGKHIYMRSPISDTNQPLFEYTLMPTKMRGFFSESSLKRSELVNKFEFMGGMNVLKVESESLWSGFQFGNKLYDVINDVKQKHVINDSDIELEMIEKMRELLVLNEAPDEQYERLGLFKDKPLTRTILLQQREQRTRSLDVITKAKLTHEQKNKVNFLKQLLKDKEGYDINEMYNQLMKVNTTSTVDEIIEMIFHDIVLYLKVDHRHKELLFTLYKNASRVD